MFKIVKGVFIDQLMEFMFLELIFRIGFLDRMGI